MVKAQWGTAEVGWPLTLALTLFLLDGGHWGSRGCLLIPTIQPFPQAMVGRKTPWSSSHHLKAFQHGPAGQGQVPQWRGQGRKQEREKKNTITKESEGKQWALESILTYHISVNICGSFYALLNRYNLRQRKPVPVASFVKKDTYTYFLSFRKKFSKAFPV